VQSLLGEVRNALAEVQRDARVSPGGQADFRADLANHASETRSQLTLLDERLEAIVRAVGTSAQVLQGISVQLERFGELITAQAAEGGRTEPVAQVRREVSDAGEHFETIGRRDEILRALGGHPPDGVVGIAPDVQGRDADRTKRRADRAARAIPAQRRFHRRLVAEHAKVLLDRGMRYAGRRPPLAQPLGVVGKNDIRRAGFEKGLVMSRAVRLIAIGHCERAIEGVGMRPRQHGERRQPIGKAIGERPGDAAAPVVADQMEAAAAIT